MYKPQTNTQPGNGADADSGVSDQSLSGHDTSVLFKEGKVIKYNNGRSGKQKQLKILANDDKVSSSDRGWLTQEMNHIKRGQRTTLRVPQGKELAHKRGFESSKGYDYGYTVLQDKNLHRLQHKFDNMGKKNSTPVSKDD